MAVRCAQAHPGCAAAWLRLSLLPAAGVMAAAAGGERSSTRDRLLAALEDLELLARYWSGAASGPSGSAPPPSPAIRSACAVR